MSRFAKRSVPGTAGKAVTATSGAAVPCAGRGRASTAFLGVALALVLAACTGTQEGGRPVLLVVATPEHVGLVAEPRDATEPPRWLAGSEQPLPAGSTIVDLVVARNAGPDGTAGRVHVVTRVGDANTLHVFDATAVPVEAPEAFVRLDTIALGPLAPDLLTEDLCTTAFDISDDGRWLALVHDPSSCELPEADQTIVLLDLDPEPGDDASWAFQGGDLVLPTFSPTDDTLFFVGESFSAGGEIKTLPIPHDSGQPGDVASVDADPLSGFGLGGAGRLVLAENDAILTLDIDGDDDAIRQESASGITAVVDSDALPAAAAVLLAGNRLVVHRDVVAENDDEGGYDTASVAGLNDAVVGPDSFAYTIGDGSVAIVDLLTYLNDPDARLTVPNRTSLAELAGAVAVDWVYGAFPETDPAGF